MSTTSRFGVVSPGPTAGHKEDNTLSPEALPEQFRDALEADDFVIYGKASIEQHDIDDVPTLIEMDALEGALDRYFESESAPGVISVGHRDIIVGRPLRSYELTEERTVVVGDETYEFEAGDELTAHVEDADDDGRPELWLPAQIDGETEFGKRMRIQALTGELDGYSVTVRRNKAEGSEEGRRITECDLHAVTLGTAETIKNPGSEFGVAEIKAALGLGPEESTAPDDASFASELVEGLEERTMGIFDDLLGKELEQKGKELQEEADTDTDAPSDNDDPAEIKDGAGDDPDEDEPAEEKMDAEAVATAMAEMMDISVDEAMAMLQEGETPDDDDDPDDDDPEDGEMKGTDEPETTGLSEEDIEAKLDEKGVVTEDELDAKLDEQAEEFKSVLGDFVDDVSETVESKLETGQTPSPSGDGGNSLSDQISESRERQGSN
ncbi:hypothetical protein Hbl1158_10125 [Halobaculum sp. CBA1158]|uniref:hypothetical protein n=1 Tax=Halobaculum sp. CBA1158 TaxID=2904243 RepID=UPI001F279F57|nr:hypothetical protein [Halobaculum sp. CBA1158]UIO98890.1 hypothetical protein Hbl1158_10125 [Halobaculum sp. CBA1158]